MIINRSVISTFTLSVFLSLHCIASDNCNIHEKVDSFNQSLNKISTLENDLSAEYDSTKNTIILIVKRKEELIKSYKLILSDIHPDGIHLINDEGELCIEVISRCAGNVFIANTHVKSMLHSKTTNKVILKTNFYEYQDSILSVCKAFTDIVNGCLETNIPDENEQLHLPIIKH